MDRPSKEDVDATLRWVAAHMTNATDDSHRLLAAEVVALRATIERVRALLPVDGPAEVMAALRWDNAEDVDDAWRAAIKRALGGE